MTHVFIANGPVTDGQRLTTAHVIIASEAEYQDAYDIMANVQHTLPTHCVVGLCGRAVMGLDENRLVVVDHVSGLGWINR